MDEKTFTLTANRIRAMAEECPDAKRMLEKGFPEAFEEEIEGEDVTEDCELLFAWGREIAVYHKPSHTVVFHITADGLVNTNFKKAKNFKLVYFTDEDNLTKLKSILLKRKE